jgi:hypothetical protein
MLGKFMPLDAPSRDVHLSHYNYIRTKIKLPPLGLREWVGKDEIKQVFPGCRLEHFAAGLAADYTVTDI